MIGAIIFLCIGVALIIGGAIGTAKKKMNKLMTAFIFIFGTVAIISGIITLITGSY